MATRIAYVINQYPAVSQTFIRREIHALERQGFEILRISMQGWDAELVDKEDIRERMKTRYVLRAGVVALIRAVLHTMFTMPVRFSHAFALAFRMGRGSERSLPYHMAYLAEACLMLPWLKSYGATHVHAHFGTNSAEVAMLAHVLGGPEYSFTVHGQNELLFGGMAEKVRRSKFVVAISSFGRSQLFRRLQYSSWTKVKVVHCGLDQGFHDIGAAEFPAARRLVCVGRLTEAKGQLLLVEAAHQLAQKGLEFELVLGGDGEMRTEVEALISHYDLSKQVRITGWISNDRVKEEILNSRALVLPSFSEGLPVVVMEAMSLRRPVLSTYVAGIPELVLHGETGWLFPAGSVNDLAMAMENCLLTSPGELKKMGDAGYLRVMERHSVDTEAAKLANFFREPSGHQ